jgi:hypothetical protein
LNGQWNESIGGKRFPPRLNYSQAFVKVHWGTQVCCLAAEAVLHESSSNFNRAVKLKMAHACLCGPCRPCCAMYAHMVGNASTVIHFAAAGGGERRREVC